MQSRQTTGMSKDGFTLIELLIVVAIIAILAAIAVPNFLEAQTRSKVSRAKADMRAIATSLESYRVDTNAYPLSFVDAPLAPGYWPGNLRTTWFVLLTTPIAYMTSIPKDSFGGDFRVNTLNDLRFLFDYRRTYLTKTAGGATTLKEVSTGVAASNANDPQGTVDSWLLYSPGPDKEQNINTHAAGRGTVVVGGFGDPLNIWCYYDPTNGTVSWGDIIRSTYGDEKSLGGR
jgi:type II secretion system protein G